MRKALAVLFELANGLVLVAVLVVGDLLLQSRSLVGLFLPLLAVAAAGLGPWRGRASALAAGQGGALLNLPLLLRVLYTAGRACGLLAFPAVRRGFASMGV